MSATGRRCGAVAIGLLLDRWLGEPPTAAHPVAWFGSVMTGLERRRWADQKVAGVVYAAVGCGIGLVSGSLIRSTAAAIGISSAGRELRRVASSVGDALTDGDLVLARDRLPSLVGRDPSQLDDRAIAAAVIESLAENSVDAVVAPAFWAIVAGAPGAVAYRAVNTMDAMVGHRTDRYRRFGWAAARLDDAANYLPARCFAAIVAATHPTKGAVVAALVRRDAPAHPSPNAGVAETAMAAVLERQLGGPLRYGDQLENRPTLGDGPRPEVADIGRAVAISDQIELAMVAGFAMVWLVDRFR